MSDNSYKRIEANAVLTLAAARQFENELDNIPSEDELTSEYSPTPELDKRIMRIIDKAHSKSKRRIYGKQIFKVAACVCIAVTLMMILLLSVGASRNYIFNAIIEWREKSSKIDFNNSRQYQGTVIYPAYIPKGFDKKSESNVFGTVSIQYENEHGETIFYEQAQAGQSGSASLDSEYTEYEPIEILGIQGYAYFGNEDSLNILVFEKNGVVFSFHSLIDMNELTKIAESIP